MLTKQDLIWLLKNLPKDITQSLIAQYYPSCFFIMDSKWLQQQDWNYQSRLIFDMRCFDLYSYYCVCLRSDSPNKQISCGHYHSVITRNGKATIYGTVDGEIPNIPENTVYIANGNNYMIIKTTNELMAYGNNNSGQLGLGDNTSRTKFTPIPYLPTNIVQIACGTRHTVIMTRDGTLMSCGLNNFGQLGLGDKTDRNKFEKIKGIPTDIVQIACGNSHTVLLRANGSIMCCGLNSHGQLGLIEYCHTTNFKEIPQFVKQITCGGFMTFILTDNNTLLSCGHSKASCQNSLINIEKFTPLDIKNIKQIACGETHVLILLDDGTLMSCGYNGYGQLGLGDTEDRIKLTTISYLPNITEIACTQFTSLIMMTDGSVMSSGNYNMFGNNSVRTKFEKIIPEQLITVQIDTGAERSEQ